ncbi:MAG: oligosaccharide flippase family protein [Bacteroidota bacterium]|nr:oligosaccharide flippase family protein [Bacteroidota bacterium]
MISKQFFKSSLIYSVVGALPYASGVILIPFFANHLTISQFGQNALYMTFMYLVQVFSTFGLDTYIGINSFDHKDSREKMGKFIGSVLLALTVMGMIVAALMMSSGSIIFKVVYKESSSMTFFPYGALTVISAIFNGIFKSYSSLLINQQRPVRFFWLNVSNFVLVIGISLTLLYLFPHTLYGPILGRLFPAVISCGLSILLIFLEYGFHFRKDLFRGMASFCFPMVVYAFMIWVVNYIDRNIIAHYMDDTSVGIFDIAVKISMFIDFVQAGLGNTIQPKVYTIWKDKNLKESTPEVNRYYNGFIAITVLCIPVLVVSIPLLVPFLIKDPKYYQAFAFLPVLCLGYASRGWFYMFLAPVFFFKKTKILPVIFSFAALFQIVSSILLIRSFGLSGAVYSSFLVKAFQALLLFLASKRFFHYSFNKWKIFFMPAVFMILVLISDFFVTDATRMLLGLGQMALSIFLVWITYRAELIPMFRKIFAR